MVLYGKDISSVLVIDPDPTLHSIFRGPSWQHCRVAYVDSLTAGKTHLVSNSPDMVFVARGLAARSVLETVKSIRSVNDRVSLVLVSATDDRANYLNAVVHQNSDLSSR